MPLHPGYRLHNRSVLGTFCIEYVASDQDVVGALKACNLANGVDGVKARLGKRGARIRLETSVGLTELPITGVNNLHDGSRALRIIAHHRIH